MILNWVQLDKDWWRSAIGYVRRVQWQGQVLYVGWRHYQPPLFYFNRLDLAKRAVEESIL